MTRTIFTLEDGRTLDGTTFRRATFRHPEDDLPHKSAYMFGDGTTAFSDKTDQVRFSAEEWNDLLLALFSFAGRADDATETLSETIEALPTRAADAVGVTPYSDMRPFVVQAVKWALRSLAPDDVGPTPSTNVSRIADAIEACDWTGCSIGNKEILKAAVIALRATPVAKGRE